MECSMLLPKGSQISGLLHKSTRWFSLYFHQVSCLVLSSSPIVVGAREAYIPATFPTLRWTEMHQTTTRHVCWHEFSPMPELAAWEYSIEYYRFAGIFSPPPRTLSHRYPATLCDTRELRRDGCGWPRWTDPRRCRQATRRYSEQPFPYEMGKGWWQGGHWKVLNQRQLPLSRSCWNVLG